MNWESVVGGGIGGAVIAVVVWMANTAMSWLFQRKAHYDQATREAAAHERARSQGREEQARSAFIGQEQHIVARRIQAADKVWQNAISLRGSIHSVVQYLEWFRIGQNEKNAEKNLDELLSKWWHLEPGTYLDLAYCTGLSIKHREVADEEIWLTPDAWKAYTKMASFIVTAHSSLVLKKDGRLKPEEAWVWWENKRIYAYLMEGWTTEEKTGLWKASAEVGVTVIAVATLQAKLCSAIQEMLGGEYHARKAVSLALTMGIETESSERLGGDPLGILRAKPTRK